MSIPRPLAQAGGACSSQSGHANVPDWFLWSLVLIGLMLAALVTLVLRFLKNDESRDGNGDG
jgi:uncharacterized membrane protein YhdT